MDVPHLVDVQFTKCRFFEKVGPVWHCVPVDETQRAKVVMQAMVNMFATGDLSPVTSTIAAEYVDHQGWRGQELDGVEGFSEVVQVARRSYVVLEVSIEDLIAEGNRAAARIRWHGTDSAGEHNHRETIDIIRVADGRAVEHWGARSSTSEAGTDGAGSTPRAG